MIEIFINKVFFNGSDMKQDRWMKTLHIRKEDLERLAHTNPQEAGYLFLFHPRAEKNMYSLAPLKVERIGMTPDSALDKEVMMFLVNHPDVSAVPYRNVTDQHEQAENFVSSIGFFEGSNGLMRLFVEVEDKKPEFFTIVKDHGYHSTKQLHHLVPNNALLRYDDRIPSLYASLSRLENTRVVQHR